MKNPVFVGTSVAIVTPFDSTGNLNLKEFGRMIDFQIENGTSCITVCGTTGEACTLSDLEHRQAISFVVEHVNKRVPVLAGTGSNDTAYGIELSKFAEAEGADALLTVTPYYNKTSQRGLVHHFNAMADSTRLPVVLYNVPSRTGISFTAESYKELSKHPNINGTKEASGDFSLVASTVALCGDELNIWSGNDDQAIALMALGGKGLISVASNITPRIMADMVGLCTEGKFQEATALQSKYLEYINNLYLEVNPIPVKAALGLIGFDVGELRLPLYEIAQSNLEKLKDSMIRAGISVK